MLKLSSSFIGIDSGERTLFDHFVEETPMWAGDGRREAVAEITFSERFLKPPAITVSVAMIDCDKATNLRLDIHARNVTETGASLVAVTWDDTRIARLRLHWQAIGPLTDPDDYWDV
ncbi:MAG: H-type lectin domain-containing protein [Rubricella sp.]